MSRAPEGLPVRTRGRGPAWLLTRGPGRGLRRPVEGLLVLLGSLGVAVWSDRSVLHGITRTVPGDLGDPLYFAWQLAWVSHALGTDPGQLWTTNAFLRMPGNLAFTDTVLGYAPLGMVTPPGQAGALAQLNLALLLATTLATAGGYALARALGSGWVGALVAGAGFGFAPWRLEQVIHINVFSTGGIALSMALLLRGTGYSLRRGWEPERMSVRWIAAGWAVACWQLTMGFATGLWFAYSLAVPGLLLALGWLISGRRRARLPWRVVAGHGLGGLAFAATAGLLVRPYLKVITAHPEAKRGEAWLPLFSPPWRGLLTAPVTSRFWGDRQTDWRASLTWQPEMVLLPGLMLIVLAAVGVLYSVWPWRRRLGLTAATAALTALAMGTRFPGGGEWTYLPLYRHVPGWDALRTPGRLIIWVTLGLCLLAAGAVGRFYADIRPRPGRRDTGAAGAEALSERGDEALLRDLRQGGPDGGPNGGPNGGGDGGPNGGEDLGGDVGAPHHPQGVLTRDRRALRRRDRSPDRPGGPGGNGTRRGGPLGPVLALSAVIVAAVPAAVVLAEGQGPVRHWQVATAPVNLTAIPGPVLLLPSDEVGDYHMMFWSTEGWPVLANGSSGFQPSGQLAMRRDAASFPDAASIATLRAQGIRSVVVIRSRSVGLPWIGMAERPVTGLPVRRTDYGDAVVYELLPPA